MTFCRVLVVFRNNIEFSIFGWGVHDSLVHLDVILGLTGPSVNVGIGMSSYLIQGKLSIVGDEIHHGTVNIRYVNDVCIN